MSPSFTRFNLLKFALGTALGFQVLIALLLVGKYPLLFRGGIYAQARTDRGGMRLVVYSNPHRSGPAETRFIPEASARLDRPGTSLESYGIWQVKKAGTYTLDLHCDDYGSLFLDGHKVISLKGISAHNLGQAVVPLQAGPHLLVVYLINEPEKGFFRLEVQGPGEMAPALLSSDLHPWYPEKAPWYWWIAALTASWIRETLFWVICAIMLLTASAFLGATNIKQAALNGLLILGSFLFAVTLGEIAARLFWPPPPKVTFREKAAPGQHPARRDQAFTIPTERGYRHAPLSELVIENNPFDPKVPLIYKTNSLGYRNPEIGLKKGTRLLFLGDSITFGQGVNEEWTFVRLLENLAQARGENWETINGAVEGLGTNGELAVLNETGLGLKPDVVVLNFYLNDFLESPGIFITRLPGLLDRSRLAHKLNGFFASRLFLNASERNLSLIQPMQKPPDEIFSWRDEFIKHSTVRPPQGKPDPVAQAFQEAVLQNFEDWGGSFSPRVWEKLELLLAEFARLAREQRFRLLLVAFPVRAQVETGPLFDYPQRRLKGIAETLGMSYCDLLPSLRTARRNGRGALFLDHCHLTPYGHQLVAPLLYRFLKKSLDSREDTSRP